MPQGPAQCVRRYEGRGGRYKSGDVITLVMAFLAGLGGENDWHEPHGRAVEPQEITHGS